MDGQNCSFANVLASRINKNVFISLRVRMFTTCHGNVDYPMVSMASDLSKRGPWARLHTLDYVMEIEILSPLWCLGPARAGSAVWAEHSGSGWQPHRSCSLWLPVVAPSDPLAHVWSNQMPQAAPELAPLGLLQGPKAGPCSRRAAWGTDHTHRPAWYFFHGVMPPERSWHTDFV